MKSAGMKTTAVKSRTLKAVASATLALSVVFGAPTPSISAILPYAPFAHKPAVVTVRLAPKAPRKPSSIARLPARLSEAQRKKLKKLSPEWSEGLSRLAQEENISYLSKTQGQLYHSDWEMLEERMFDESWSRNARQRYRDLNRNYEIQREHGIVRAHSDTDQIQQNARLASALMNEAVRKEVSEQVTLFDLKKNSSSAAASTERRLFAPKKEAAASSDREWKEPLVRMVPRTDVVGMRGQLWIQNAFADTFVDVVASRPLDTYHPALGKVAGQVPTFLGFGSTPLDRQNMESVRFSLSRQLPIWELQSGMSYGVSSTVFSATLSKQFTPALRAVVSQSQGSDPIRSGLNGATDSRLSVFYDFRF